MKKIILSIALLLSFESQGMNQVMIPDSVAADKSVAEKYSLHLGQNANTCDVSINNQHNTLFARTVDISVLNLSESAAIDHGFTVLKDQNGIINLNITNQFIANRVFENIYIKCDANIDMSKAKLTADNAITINAHILKNK